MHLILTGATGLVGSATLDAMIKMKEVTKISVISRRPVKMAEDAADPRVNVILHKDFEKYDQELLDKLHGATGCVWALGISQTAVSKEDYVKITMDYAVAAARAFQTLATDEKPFNFVYVSGRGSTLKPGTLTPLFGRIKGETERILSVMRNENPPFRASTIRPAFIDYAAHDAIKPYVPPQGAARSALLGVFGPVIRATAKGACSPTIPLGRFMTEMAMGKWEAKLQSEQIEKLGDFPILENTTFRKLAGLDAESSRG